MGWLNKCQPICAILGLFLFCSAVQTDSSTDCDLANTKSEPIVVDINDGMNYLNVKNFDKRAIDQCIWKISVGGSSALFELSRIILAPNDNLEVIGLHVDKVNTTMTLFNGTGSQVFPGLVTSQTCTFITVTLSLSKNVFERVYSSAFYWKKDVQLVQETGLLAFPLNSDQKSQITTDFTLQPSSDFVDHFVLLNFMDLPATYSFSVNGDDYSNTKPPTTFLQINASAPIKIEFKSYNQSSPIKALYSLVSANCSQIFNLPLGGKEQPILYPIEDFRKLHHFSNIKCAQLFIAPEKAKFQLLIDPKVDGLANPGDTITVYDLNGNIEINLNAPALTHFRKIENYLNGSRHLVVYDSPFALANTKKFIPPSMKVIANDAAGLYLLNDTPLTIQVPGASKASPIVHILYPADLATSSSKHAIVEFEQNVKLSPGQTTISIYSSEDTSAQPLVTLGQFDSLPSAIASNTPVMRVVFSGTIQPLKVTYRLVDSSQSCQYISTLNPTFEVKGGPLRCSWYVPQASNPKPISNYTVINPTIITIPKGKVLNVTTFGAKGSKTVSYPGPIDEFYFPDMYWLNLNNAYEFSIDASNVAKEALHLLFVQKNNYLEEVITPQPSEKLSSISSVNYPGYYPVGFTETWMFINTNSSSNVLITVDDVHLKNEHQLTLLKDKTNIDWKGDYNLTNVPDNLISYPFSIYLDSTNFNLTSFSNRGFHVSLQYPGISKEVAVTDKPESITFSSLQNVSSNPLNIWQINADVKSKLWSDTILHINVTLAEGLDKTKAKLDIYDSISLRKQTIHSANGGINGTNGFFLGSIRSALIVYDYSASIGTKTDFSVNFTITAEKCQHTKDYNVSKCATVDRCITDLMICNGVNDCGDYTDELYCNGTHPQPPPTPTPASSGGVNTFVVIFVLMPLSAVLGIVGYIYLPQFLLRIRRGRYSEFRDLSDVS